MVNVYFDIKTSVAIKTYNPNEFPNSGNVTIHASSDRKAEKERKILTNLIGIVLTDERFR